MHAFLHALLGRPPHRVNSFQFCHLRPFRRRALRILALLAFAHCLSAQDTFAQWRSLQRRVAALELAGELEQETQSLRKFIAENSRLNEEKYLAWCWNRLGLVEQAESEYLSAEADFRRAIELEETIEPLDASNLASALENLSSLYVNIGDPARAEPYLKRALDVKTGFFGEQSPEVAISYTALAAVAYARDRYSEAESLSRKAISIWSAVGDGDVRSAGAYSSLGLARMEQKDFSEAAALAEKAIEIDGRARIPDERQLAEHTYNLAYIYQRSHRLREAVQAYRRSLTCLSSLKMPDLNLEAAILEHYAEVLAQTGSKQQSRAISQRANALRSQVAAHSGFRDTVPVDRLSGKQKLQ